MAKDNTEKTVTLGKVVLKKNYTRTITDDYEFEGIAVADNGRSFLIKLTFNEDKQQLTGILRKTKMPGLEERFIEE